MALTENELRAQVLAHPEKPDAYTELASLLFDSHRFDEALATLWDGLAAPLQDSDRATLLVTSGWYLYQVTGDTGRASSLAEEAIALTQGLETSESLLARAMAEDLIAEFLWETEPIRAAQLAESALSLFGQILRAGGPGEPSARFEACAGSARLNCLLGRLDAASREAEQAVRTAPDRNGELTSRTVLGMVYRRAGRLVEARETLTEAIQLPHVAQFKLVPAYFELSLTEAALGKPAEARAKAQKGLRILREDPALPRFDWPQFLSLIGDISYEMGDIEEAARSFQEASDGYQPTESPYWTCLLWLACCQSELGNLEPARVNAERVRHSALASDSQREQARELLGEIEAARPAATGGPSEVRRKR